MPRKTAARALIPARIPPASMRPRPDAAENPTRTRQGRSACAASMRPRPDAAENQYLGDAAGLAARASMRPRPDAAENRTRR